jgi:glycerate kinase
VISRTVLVAPEPFADGLDARRAAAAIGRGLQAVQGLWAGATTLAMDLCPIDERDRDGAPIKEHLDALGFDARMRAARAVIVGAARLDEATLLGSATFEIATRARQAGVPAYAVTGSDELSAFDARILDLQVILQARDTRMLRRAGERLAGLV